MNTRKCKKAAAAMADPDVFDNEKLLEPVNDIAPYFAEALCSLPDIPVVTDIHT